MDDRELQNMIYVITKHEVVKLAHQVQGLDLKKALEAISRAETVGPMIDPTLYREGQQKLHWDERLMRALSVFQLEAATIFREIELWERAQVENEKQRDSTS